MRLDLNFRSTGEPPNFSDLRSSFTDVIIHCENGTKIIKASSIVLAEASPFIATLLSLQTGEFFNHPGFSTLKSFLVVVSRYWLARQKRGYWFDSGHRTWGKFP